MPTVARVPFFPKVSQPPRLPTDTEVPDLEMLRRSPLKREIRRLKRKPMGKFRLRLVEGGRLEVERDRWPSDAPNLADSGGALEGLGMKGLSADRSPDRVEAGTGRRRGIKGLRREVLEGLEGLSLE